MLVHAHFVSNEALYIYTHTYLSNLSLTHGDPSSVTAGKETKNEARRVRLIGLYTRAGIYRRNSVEHASAIIES